MATKLKSLWLLVVIFVQKLADILWRVLTGVPNLKRSQITADLFLGGQYNLRGLRKLKDLGITGIINMRENPSYAASVYEGFRYLHLPTVDNTPPTLDDLRKGANFADAEVKNGGKIYIHCRQGLGRGPSMAIAYLLKRGMTYEDAFALVKSVRTFINPRPGQIARLRELEQYYARQAERTP